jgi:ribonuclease BN (tRNA processing enzyme)
MNVRASIVVFLALVLIFSWGLAGVLYYSAGVGERVAPVDPREFSSLTLVAVGTGGAYENPERLGPSTAVGWGSQLALVDVGRGIAEALRSARIPVWQPDVVYLTSLMPENLLGLDDLLLTGWLEPRSQPLRIVGPQGTRAFVEGLQQAYSQTTEAQSKSLNLPLAGARFEVEEVGEGWSEQRDGLSVTAGAISGGPLPALAWRFEAKGRSAVISATGWAQDDLVAFASGADMLVHEAAYIPNPADLEETGVLTDPDRLEREAAIHSSILTVGKLAKRARVRSLALVRMRPPPFFNFQVTSIVGESYEGKILIPADGDELLP